MNKKVECPLCDSSNVIYKFRENNHSLYVCNNCSLSFINPYVQKGENRNILSADRQLKSEESVIKSYFPYIIEYIQPDDNLLDIGCGCGTLLKKVKEVSGNEGVGIEYDESRVNMAKKNAKCEILNIEIENFSSEGIFAVITLINVISHITNLNIFFLKLLSLSKPKGKLIIKTGLMKSDYRKRNVFDWQIPEHIHFFGEKTSAYLADKFNLRIIKEINNPLSEELISKDYMMAPGRSQVKNFLKKVVLYLPFGLTLARFLYDKYTRDKFYSTIVIFEKK